MVGPGLIAMSASGTLDVSMGLAMLLGSATVTKVGVVFSAIKISTFAQTTSRAKMAPHVSILAKGLTPAAVLLVTLEVIVRKEL